MRFRLGSSLKESRLPHRKLSGGQYAGPQKTLEREALLKRHRELQAEIAQLERDMREGEARLPIEEQLSLKLRRFIEANIPELAGKLRIQVGSGHTEE